MHAARPRGGKNMSKEKTTEWSDFDEEMKLFKIFWDKYLKSQWPYYFEDKKDEKKFKSDSKMLIYLFLYWLDKQGITLQPPPWGSLAYDLILEIVKLEKSKKGAFL